MPKARQRREGPDVGAWEEDMEQAGRAAVVSDAVVIISPRGSIPDVQPGDDEPQASHGAVTGFPGIGAASPGVEP